jgi:hypothetical protein
MYRLLLVTLLISGCVHVSKNVVIDRSDQPILQDDVEVYSRAEQVPAECELVAYLHASASDDFSDEAEVVEKFRKQAGELGANAVMVRKAWANGSARPASVFASPSSNEFDAEAFWCSPEEGGS